MAAKLTAKQQRFVEEYLVDLNATQAAIRAGYSPKTARKIGSQNLSKLIIAEAIAEAQEARSARTHITQDRVLQELARIGFSDIRRIMTAKGALLDPAEWDDEAAAAISSIEVVTNSGDHGKDEEGRKIVERTHKIKVWDKNSALERLGRHLGMFPNKHEHSGPDGSPLEIVVKNYVFDDSAEDRDTT